MDQQWYKELSAGKGYCPNAGKDKTRYLSFGAAQAGLKYIRTVSYEEIKQIPYWCKCCHIWHLATKKGKENQSGD